MSAPRKKFVPTKQAPATRSNSSTPTKAARPAPTTRASSEVRQAILALKAKQGATRSARASPSPFEAEEQEISEVFTSSPLASSSSVPAFDDVEEEFGPSVSSVIEKAKSNGRLVLASRSLQAVPSEVYSALISPANPLHPSNRAPKSFFKKDQVVDLSISRSEEDDSSNVRWYEQSPLTVLKLSNNEIDHLDEELGGLTDLENLDVHCNCLSTIPLSISNLASLTILNFSSNQLEGSVPLPILNLEHLVNLDLSNNMLTALWSEDWRSQLKDCLANKPSEADDSFNTESSQGDDFWSTFPSSPVKQRSGTTQEALTPFPALRILNLSHNRLPTNALTVLPSSLVQLDLSSNALFTTLPPFYFEELEALNLSSNELPDTVFHPTSALPKLNSLDLSNNAINTLAPLEALFGSINYLSIPPALTKMIKPTSSKLSIRISGNVLAAEPARRRQLRNQAAAFPILPPQQSQPIRVAAASDDSYKTAESGDDLPAELAKLELSSKAFPYAEEIHNGQLDLSGRGMELFPTGEKCEGEVKSLILAKNGLKDVSMPALESWGLFVGLQKLDLSRNRITTFEEAGTFEALASLDLSANRLALPDIFDIISRTAPNIKSLDLTYNVLDNLEGVQPLLLRKGGGLRSLKLSGNRFADVSPLTEVAVQIKAGASGWACEEIDLRDNEIGKLHPELGWLPLSSFQVEGNVFRIPQRRVWETGGTAGLLQWLKDKIA